MNISFRLCSFPISRSQGLIQVLRDGALKSAGAKSVDGEDKHLSVRKTNYHTKHDMYVRIIFLFLAVHAVISTHFPIVQFSQSGIVLLFSSDKIIFCFLFSIISLQYGSISLIWKVWTAFLFTITWLYVPDFQSTYTNWRYSSFPSLPDAVTLLRSLF